MLLLLVGNCNNSWNKPGFSKVWRDCSEHLLHSRIRPVRLRPHSCVQNGGLFDFHYHASGLTSRLFASVFILTSWVKGLFFSPWKTKTHFRRPSSSSPAPPSSEIKPNSPAPWGDALSIPDCPPSFSFQSCPQSNWVYPSEFISGQRKLKEGSRFDWFRHFSFCCFFYSHSPVCHVRGGEKVISQYKRPHSNEAYN